MSSFYLFSFTHTHTHTQSKHLQFVNGVHITSYWSATFAWDLLNASIPVIISLILFAAFQVDAYTNDGLAGAYLLLVSQFSLYSYVLYYLFCVDSFMIILLLYTADRPSLPPPSPPSLPPSLPQILVVWASIPLTYVFSFLFNNYLAAFGIFFCFYYFSAVVMQILVLLLGNRGFRDLADTLHFIFLTFPSYG